MRMYAAISRLRFAVAHYIQHPGIIIADFGIMAILFAICVKTGHPVLAGCCVAYSTFVVSAILYCKKTRG